MIAAPVLVRTVPVLGPWSLMTCRSFWEGFTPNRLPAGAAADGVVLRSVFLGEQDWRRVQVAVEQDGQTAVLRLQGHGDLEAAAEQVRAFLSLDVDARGWPAVGERDPVIADAQRQLPGLRPCGFHSPYEAAAWSVLSQRIRMVQAARLREDLVARHGEDGAFPAPQTLLQAQLDLPGRKAEYLQAVAQATLDGHLSRTALRRIDPSEAIAQVQQVRGLGPFAAELVVLRGANAPDAMPSHEARLSAVIKERYGADADPECISEAWRPLRTWAAVHLRVLAEQQ